KYVHLEKGYNSRLDELQAAFLRVKLRRLDEWNQRRAALAERYLKRLSGIAAMTLPAVLKGAEPVWHIFPIRTDKRDALQASLATAGVGTLVHYPTPPHLQPAYADAGW